MSKTIWGLAIACLYSVSLNASDIEGTYNVTGFDPYEKKSYKGTVEISKNANNVYQAHWTLNLDPSGSFWHQTLLRL